MRGSRTVPQCQTKDIAPALVRKRNQPPRGLPAVSLGIVMAAQGEAAR